MPATSRSRDPSLLAPTSRRLPLAALLLLGMLSACSDNHDDPPPLASETIGTAGGAVGIADRSAALTVPPGALAGDVSFRIDPGQLSIVPGYVDVGPAYAFAPAGTVAANR